MKIITDHTKQRYHSAIIRTQMTRVKRIYADKERIQNGDKVNAIKKQVHWPEIAGESFGGAKSIMRSAYYKIGHWQLIQGYNIFVQTPAGGNSITGQPVAGRPVNQQYE